MSNFLRMLVVVLAAASIPAHADRRALSGEITAALAAEQAGDYFRKKCAPGRIDENALNDLRIVVQQLDGPPERRLAAGQLESPASPVRASA